MAAKVGQLNALRSDLSEVNDEIQELNNRHAVLFARRYQRRVCRPSKQSKGRRKKKYIGVFAHLFFFFFPNYPNAV